MTIGSSPACTWTVEDDHASPVHCVITQLPDGSLWLDDLGSISGTSLNDQRIYQRTRIYSGDRVQVGQTVLTIP